MATMDQKLSPEQNELVAIGAGVGSGCHPCVDHHLKTGARAGLDAERLLATVTSAERVAAEAAFRMRDHVRGKLGPAVAAPALLSRLEEALASLGAALGANDAASIELQLRTALDSGATGPQLAEAIATAKTVQENAARIHVRDAERLLETLATPQDGPESETDSGEGCGCGEPAEERPNGAAAAMAGHRQMFERWCRQPGMPAETDDVPAAAVPAGGCLQET